MSGMFDTYKQWCDQQKTKIISKHHHIFKKEEIKVNLIAFYGRISIKTKNNL